MKNVTFAKVLQKAVKYNKTIRKTCKKSDFLHYEYDLRAVGDALEKVLAEAASYGQIAMIWNGNLIDRVYIGDSLIEV